MRRQPRRTSVRNAIEDQPSLPADSARLDSTPKPRKLVRYQQTVLVDAGVAEVTAEKANSAVQIGS